MGGGGDGKARGGLRLVRVDKQEVVLTVSERPAYYAACKDDYRL